MTNYTPTTSDVRAEYVDRCMDAYDRQVARDEFDRWLAAHDAEVRAGVVTEEPEWEYGTLREVVDGWERGDRYGEHQYVSGVSGRLNHDPSTVTGVRPLDRAVRRRKAGPWVPVQQEGADQ